MRPSAAAVLVAAVVLAGCGRHEQTLSGRDRQACRDLAARAGDKHGAAYNSVFADCVHNTLHPERGGG